MNRKLSIIILILCFISCNTETKTKIEILETSKGEKIDKLANRYLELNRFSGVILIIKEGTIIYNNNFGFANYETKTPFSTNTAFKIGEVSEIITADLIKEMAKKDKFNLSDKISTYIPEIKSDLSIYDFLNHKTNLPNLHTIHEHYPELEYSTINYANLALELSDKSKQSDLNYNILGLLIETISGKTFQENLEYYSKELSLQNTYFQKSDSSLAVGYLYHNYRGNGLELQIAPVSNSDITFSSKGIKSSANDLIKIINANSTEELEINGYLENDGFSYSINNNPKTKMAIVVLSNRRHPIAKEISTSVEAIIANKDYNLPLPRKKIDIDKSLLKEYSGFYTLNDNMTLEVIYENNSLFVMMGPNKIHLIPQSQNQFYMEQTDASMRFLRNTDNEINQVVLLDGFLEGNTIERKEN